MENRNTRGSVWRKWDLHIHSTASDGSSSPQEIITQARAKGLSVIALTDHHTAKNIDETKSKGRHEGVTVISGIEFRSEYGGKSVHFIGLFPDTYKGEELSSKALNDLVLCPLGVSETTIIMKARELKEYSEDGAAFKDGMFLVQVDFKKASELIHSYGGLVSVHNGSKENGLDAEVKHQGRGVRNVSELYDSLGTLKEELLTHGYIDVCEIRKENDNEKFYLDEFSKPSIIASDAHETSSIGSKFVWIKADPTFEGLRQITYEPVERVKIQVDVPERRNDYQVIESFSINHPEFGTQTIPLNQGLNTIIGGRSSGKSILLGSIAKKIGSLTRVKENKPDYDEYLRTLLPYITLTWKDGVSNNSRDIDFFPQSYINSLAADSIEVNKFIENVIKNDPVKKTEIDAHISFCIDNKSKINQEIANYFALKEKAKELQSEIAVEGNKEGVEKEIEKDKQELQNAKGLMGAPITPEEEAQYKKVLQIVATATLSIDAARKNISKLEAFKKIKVSNDIGDQIIGVPDGMASEINLAYKDLRIDFSAKWTVLLQQHVAAEEEVIRKSTGQLLLAEKDATFVKCFEYYGKNDAYSESEKRLRAEEEKLRIINELENEVSNLNSIVEGKGKLILKLNNEFYLKANELAAKLRFENGEVVIGSSPSFCSRKFHKVVAVHFDLRSPETNSLLEYEHVNNDQHVKFFEDIFERLTNGQIPFKAAHNLQQTLIDIFAETYYDIEYDVTYENDNLSSMSEGKKAFIILRILLDFNARECPILIDQPEDDLDNRAIYDQLVKYVKAKKKERQIILVTHNPNIVVGADAEEVIVSNQHGINSLNQDNVKFEYLTGSLENTLLKDPFKPVLIGQGIRQHVCDVLEGGDEAFRKREQKYGTRIL